MSTTADVFKTTTEEAARNELAAVRLYLRVPDGESVMGFLRRNGRGAETFEMRRLREAAEHTVAVLDEGDHIEPDSRIHRWTKEALDAYNEKAAGKAPQ